MSYVRLILGEDHVENRTVAVIRPYAFEDPQLLAFGSSDPTHARLGGEYPSLAALAHRVARNHRVWHHPSALTLSYSLIIHEVSTVQSRLFARDKVPLPEVGCAEGEALHTVRKTRLQAPLSPWMSPQVACRIEASVGNRLAEDRDTLSHTLFERSVGHLSEECA